MRRLKFEDQPGIAGPLGRLLADASDLRFGRDGRPWDVICHVPLHPTRVWSRGYDQAQLLVEWSAHHLRRRYGLQAPVGRRVLERTRPTVPQSELGLAQRLANLRGAFAVRNPQRLRGRRILVVDDVTTSGATFHACFDALREAGATAVGGLALMRTLHELPSMRATAS